MTNPSVSLIIPVYNGGIPFQNCVKSVLEIQYPPDKLQVILVDDCSTDGTFDWLKAQSLPSYIIIVHHGENRGRAAARNSGIMQATGEILIFIDGDMCVSKDFIQSHINALNKDSVVAVAGRIIADPRMKRTRVNRYLFEYSKRGAKQFGEHIPISFQYLLTGNMAINRDALEAAGSFDENMIGYGGEDTLFAYKIWKAFPQGIRYCASAITTHQQNDNLDELLKKAYHYGKFNLPRLLDEYPDMTEALRGDFLVGNSPKKRMTDFLCNPLFKMVVRIKYWIMPYPLSNWVIRYLLMCATRDGFTHRLESGIK